MAKGKKTQPKKRTKAVAKAGKSAKQKALDAGRRFREKMTTMGNAVAGGQAGAIATATVAGAISRRYPKAAKVGSALAGIAGIGLTLSSGGKPVAVGVGVSLMGPACGHAFEMGKEKDLLGKVLPK